MTRIIFALLAVAVLTVPAEAKRHKHHHGHVAVHNSSTCGALRQLHAQVGTAGLEAMGQQVGVTPSQRASAIACLRSR